VRVNTFTLGESPCVSSRSLRLSISLTTFLNAAFMEEDSKNFRQLNEKKPTGEDCDI